MSCERCFAPALGQDRRTPFYDVVVGTTARDVFRVLKPDGGLRVADWGHPRGPLMRVLFVAIQLLDGFENTRDNTAGKLVPLFEQGRVVAMSTTQAFNAVFRTLVLYRATKPAGRTGLGS